MIRNGYSRADLHVHSKYSNRPSEWFLRRIGAPESFTEPSAIYESCRERGMDFVTVSDHNSIAGALEIAHLPGTFLSSEITTYFPEEREQGARIWSRGSTSRPLPKSSRCARTSTSSATTSGQAEILHWVAHPLHRINDKLSAGEFEQLLLLFRGFEAVNGARHPRANLLTRTILESLSPELIGELEERHDIPARGVNPHHKYLSGGSDDHGGLYVASAYTETPCADTVEDFLRHLRSGVHHPGGRGGTSLRLAESIYHIALSYYRGRFLNGEDTDSTVIGALLRRLAGEQSLQPSRRVWPAFVERAIRTARKRRLSDVERIIFEEFTAIMAPDRPASLRERFSAPQQPPTPEQQFRLACTVAHQLTFRFLKDTSDRFRHGRIVDGLQSLSAIGPVMLGVAPYITAFGVQHKDQGFLRSIADRFPAARGVRIRSGKKAWVTDTLSDVNGVAHTINVLSSLAKARGRDITVVTSLEHPPIVDYPLRNFPPVGVFHLPEYESQAVVFPPFLDMLDYFENEGFDEIIISTPGPMGLAALGIATLLRVPTKGIYHTDLPTYVGQLTDDDTMADLSWRYMRSFYGRMDTILVQSRFYLEQLASRGFDPDRMRIMGKGVDLDRFSPQRRDPDFWRRHRVNGDFLFLYVGRVSREKNLEPMLEAFEQLNRENPEVSLAIVGDGPALSELKAAFEGPAVFFTGYLTGDGLAAAYAGADAFVFPSMTDTYGNVVLEAHASGLPAIVSDQGGPPEIVASHESGLIVDMRDCGAIRDAMQRLLTDDELRDRLSRNALRKARESRWDAPLQVLL